MIVNYVKLKLEFLRRLARRVIVAFTIGMREYPDNRELLDRAKRTQKWDKYKQNLKVDLKAKACTQKLNEAFISLSLSSPSNSRPVSREHSSSSRAKLGLTDKQKIDEEIEFGR